MNIASAVILCTIVGAVGAIILVAAAKFIDVYKRQLTARENIYLNGTVLGFSPKYLDEKFDEIVEFSELQNFLDVPLKNYSSGMVARIGFAIATITKPDILKMCIRDRDNIATTDLR